MAQQPKPCRWAGMNKCACSNKAFSRCPPGRCPWRGSAVLPPVDPSRPSCARRCLARGPRHPPALTRHAPPLALRLCTHQPPAAGRRRPTPVSALERRQRSPGDVRGDPQIRCPWARPCFSDAALQRHRSGPTPPRGLLGWPGPMARPLRRPWSAKSSPKPTSRA